MSSHHPVPIRYRFIEDHHTGAFVCTHVWSERQPILMVTHEEDGSWQFLCGAAEHTDASEAKLVCLADVVSRDLTVNEVADIGPSHVATREAIGEPWDVEDYSNEDIQAIVDEHGWWVGLIPSENDLPGFAYTIGLYERFEHPELIVIGLAKDTMHHILNDCGARIRDGERFDAGASASGLIEGYDVRFRSVNDASSYLEYLGFGLRYYDRKFPVLQCIWPDKSGRFPGEFAAAPILKKLQPLLP